MKDEKLYNIYRYLVDVQGINPELPKMREFRDIIDHDTTDILDRVKNIQAVKALSGVYG